MIRLLNKREIDKRKADELKRDIDEGLKVARSVDALRELRADEDGGLQKWRREAIAVIHSEIQVKMREKAELYREVKELREERRTALDGIDAERDRLDDKESDLAQKAHKLERFKLDLDAREVQLNGTRFELNAQRGLIRDIHRETSEKTEEARTILVDAERRSKIVDKVIADVARREESIAKREQDFERLTEDKDASLKKLETALVEAEQELGKREKRVRDDLKTLERNKKR